MTITAPMMMKIHRAIPASLKLIDLAKAGVTIPTRSGMINPTIIPANQDFLPFDIPHSPFLMGSNLNIAFHMPT
jgi:hypothetical protein